MFTQTRAKSSDLSNLLADTGPHVVSRKRVKKMCSHCADVGELRRHETVLQSYMFERSALKFQFHCQLVQSVHCLASMNFCRMEFIYAHSVLQVGTQDRSG